MTKELEKIFLEGLEQNKEKLFRICSIYSTDSENANDLFQDVLINIWQSIPSFKFKSSISTWMFRITLNVCLRLQSSQKKKHLLFKSIGREKLENISIAEENEEKDRRLIYLRNCIKHLNEADKSIITLYLEELSYREISEITGLTENNIAVKVKRIRNKLLNCISEAL